MQHHTKCAEMDAATKMNTLFLAPGSDLHSCTRYFTTSQCWLKVASCSGR